MLKTALIAIGVFTSFVLFFHYLDNEKSVSNTTYFEDTIDLTNDSAASSDSTDSVPK